MITGLGLLAERVERLRSELDQYSYMPGDGEFAKVEYCKYCHYSREWIAKHGHDAKCILKGGHNGTV